MPSQTSTFTKLFALWPSDIELASDMGVPRSRARQWIARDYISPWYWPRLTDLALTRFGRRFTYRQLVEATAARRGLLAPTDEGEQSAEAA